MDRSRHPVTTHTVVTAHQIWREAVRSGLDADELGRLTGLDPRDLTDFARRLPSQRLFSVWEAVVRRLDDPEFPLRTARAAQHDTRSAVTFLAAASSDVREGIARSVANVSAWTTAYTLGAHPTPDGGLALVLDGLGPERLGARCEAEFQLSEFLAGIRGTVDGGYVPRQVRFAHPAPPDARAHREWFGPGLEFGARHTELVLCPDVLGRPLPTAQPGLVGVLTAYVSALLPPSPAPAPSYGTRVRRWLADLPPSDGPPAVSAAARALAVSERTLHRRLAEEGTTFRSVYDAARRDHAVHLVRTTRRPLKEIAALVGFADPRSFHRAYHRWTGTTPSRDRTPHPL